MNTLVSLDLTTIDAIIAANNAKIEQLKIEKARLVSEKHDAIRAIILDEKMLSNVKWKKYTVDEYRTSLVSTDETPLKFISPLIRLIRECEGLYVYVGMKPYIAHFRLVTTGNGLSDINFSKGKLKIICSSTSEFGKFCKVNAIEYADGGKVYTY